ncbi:MULTISPECIES: McrB family protein [unclassified Pseudomonas]|uniref:McrB family protein n=1 Tax=unclassified Pseudomonas TaxID=196821 RepID=UPI001CBE58B0|nr:MULTISPECIES: hypothetical protein [unclassified Pseudomonas]
MLAEINQKFSLLLNDFVRGISNTSTSKYTAIRDVLAEGLGLKPESIYITGAAKRISNLDTRLAQGNQRNQHTPLGVAFINIPSGGKSREDTINAARSSFTTTVRKFVSGEERGTHFDGVLGFIQVDNESVVVPLVFLYSQSCSFVDEVKSSMPDFDAHSLLINRVVAPGVVTSEASLTGSTQVKQAFSAVLDSSLISLCSKALNDAGMKVSEGVLSRFVASLLVKRFVIMAGLSGSGKTKLAIAFAEWIKEFDEQLKVVSVGADWNGTESVFGYRDALDPNRFVKPVSGILDIVIRAEEDPSRPYFLILDEMNLSHVERYFSDFLSAMESDCEINLHTAEDAIEGVPPSIELPKNLFIVGTVNVDETTYMFSPKVLDRANVIEFTVDESDLKDFLGAPSKIDMQSIVGLGKQYQSAIVESAKRTDVDLKDLPIAIADGSAVQQQITDMLLQGFRLLKPIGAEFGFRTAIEVIRFTYFHAQLVGSGWGVKDSFDAQMVQKLMPKLHGSERRLRPVLDALEELCNTSGLKLSGEKVSRMQGRLRDGFTSFLE